MVKNIGLVIAKIANWILSEMWVIKRQNFQIREPIKVENFFETANLIPADVEIIQLY